ncbi:NAD-dependent epimerase/dehydratase family protein [Pedobacter sp. GR22-10]|uniref:NAD-dependent epimerase/dehydratase family protein n=1 Tax=Pedobacter sp. GR22-10 TaxID=2994472 RepID=UPI0022467956|nr:NAD-dependent epimerase/dehydratase family protein [Pedobacter sp. GR22-10]MCX2432362.1 NAD-dependent epimerase/dehydratase family protein [Pedobacter sp. GR22-10]
MKILIIGSKGFIGGHLANYLSPIHDVWGADVVSSNLSYNYFKLELQNTNFEVIFEKHQFDICINASGNGSVPISLTKPVFDFELNVTNTIKILDAIKVHNPECRFINMSSAAVYGNPGTLPIKETIELKPLSPYGWHKLYAEQICKEYYYLYNIKTINLRLFSVYGEHLRKQLFWDTYQKTIRSSAVELFGTGKETRDFIYIGDLVEAIHCVIDRGLFNGEAINVASGIEITIEKAAKIFCKEIDENIIVSFNNIVKPGDPLNWKADISVLCSFGFLPKTTIEQGLINTVKWLKENK